MTAAATATTATPALDRAALSAYLSRHVPGFDDEGLIVIEQFTGGQSNPTYCLSSPSGRYVLRKKPAGHLLPSAHSIEREFALMRALHGLVPVPRTYLLCEDETVLGQPFYIMAFVEGRLLTDARMLEAPHEERRALCLELVSVLARLHQVDYWALGLETFGRPGGYLARQLSRLSKQYAASRVEENADMDFLIRWLEENLPRTDESAIVHGDYRSYNVLFAAEAPRIAAVLDWELATIGHPLADLAFCCLPYHMSAHDPRGFHGDDPIDLGIPAESELLDHYCRETGRGDLPDWHTFLVFSLFRSAAIRAGVYKRGFDGSAASPDALQAGRTYRDSAAAAARLIRTSEGAL
jgi:aminoglycoside phosphotransferase (APT) family kinase protein